MDAAEHCGAAAEEQFEQAFLACDDPARATSGSAYVAAAVIFRR